MVHGAFGQELVKQQLYGLGTNNNGRCSLVIVDSQTGKSTLMFDFALPAQGRAAYGLAYHPGTKRFYASLYDQSFEYHGMIEINPVTQSVVRHILPFSWAEGVAYLPQYGKIATAFSNTGYATSTLALLNEDASVATTVSIPVIDADNLGTEPLANRLLVMDINNPTSGYTLNGIFDLLGVPSRIGLYNGPISGTEIDLATLGMTIYTSRQTHLCRFSPGYASLDQIGPYQHPLGHFVMGLTAAPRRLFTALPGN
jgi:hypothetical protein